MFFFWNLKPLVLTAPSFFVNSTEVAIFCQKEKVINKKKVFILQLPSLNLIPTHEQKVFISLHTCRHDSTITRTPPPHHSVATANIHSNHHQLRSPILSTHHPPMVTNHIKFSVMEANSCLTHSTTHIQSFP